MYDFTVCLRNYALQFYNHVSLERTKRTEQNTAIMDPWTKMKQTYISHEITPINTQQKIELTMSRVIEQVIQFHCNTKVYLKGHVLLVYTQI